MTDPVLTHTDALAALLADPNYETCTALPVEQSCSVCGLTMPAGTVALVCMRAQDDGDSYVSAQASHRACIVIADENSWYRWSVGETLVDHLCDDVCGVADTIDLPAEPALLDVVPDDLHDEWRAVWAGLRGGSRG